MPVSMACVWTAKCGGGGSNDDETTTIVASGVFFSIFLRCFVFLSDYEIAFQFNSVVVYRLEYIPFRSTFRPLIFLVPHTNAGRRRRWKQQKYTPYTHHLIFVFGIVYGFGLVSVEAIHLRIQFFVFDKQATTGLETSIAIDFCVLCVWHKWAMRLCSDCRWRHRLRLNLGWPYIILAMGHVPSIVINAWRHRCHAVAAATAGATAATCCCWWWCGWRRK